MLSNLQFLFARQIPLFSCDGKKYQIEVEWTKEGIAIDDISNIELTVVSPNKTDPKSTDTNTTQTIKQLKNSLKLDTLVENKPTESELEQALFFLVHESRGIRL